MRRGCRRGRIRAARSAAVGHNYIGHNYITVGEELVQGVRLPVAQRSQESVGQRVKGPPLTYLFLYICKSNYTTG